MALNSRSCNHYWEKYTTSLPSFHITEQNCWEIFSFREQNYKVTYHTITSSWVVFGLSTSPRNRPHRKSRFNALRTCEWQPYPQGSLGVTLIGPSAPTRFWVGKIGANQVWKVLRPAPYEIRRRTFWKSNLPPPPHSAKISMYSLRSRASDW